MALVAGYFIEAYSPTLILSATGVLLLFFGFGFCSPCAPTIVSVCALMIEIII